MLKEVAIHDQLGVIVGEVISRNHWHGMVEFKDEKIPDPIWVDEKVVEGFFEIRSMIHHGYLCKPKILFSPYIQMRSPITGKNLLVREAWDEFQHIDYEIQRRMLFTVSLGLKKGSKVTIEGRDPYVDCWFFQGLGEEINDYLFARNSNPPIQLTHWDLTENGTLELINWEAAT